MLPYDVEKNIRKCTDDFQSNVKDIKRMDESTRLKIQNIKQKLMTREQTCRNCALLEENIRIKTNNLI